MTTAEAAEFVPTLSLTHEKSKKAQSALSTCPDGCLASPADKQNRHQGDQSRSGRSAAAPFRAAVVLQQRCVALLGSAVGRLVAADGALDQRHLVGGGSLLWLVWAGAIARPLAIVE